MLGAGALAAAGLRSITAKHLAMAAQCVGAIMGLHPALTAILTGPLPHSRRAILLPDFERLLQVAILSTSQCKCLMHWNYCSLRTCYYRRQQSLHGQVLRRRTLSWGTR